MAATLQPTPAVNQAVRLANDLPALVNQLQQIDPALGQQITGKSLLASKSVWGNILVPAVVYAAGRLGLQWDHDLCAEVAGGALILSTIAFRAVTNSPITSWIRKRVSV